MSGEVVQLRPALYRAKSFPAGSVYGEFEISGTLCGCVDLRVPKGLTYTLTPDEVQMLIVSLTNARADVLENSRPTSDPRLVG